ncbi:hypothetical protein EGW08_023131 [Elysia chlorotica]|uniref:CCHC-type domain-containing protein n=1 Tax=Elysia chlorotica TaxID=188477 RepID=A0A433SJA6_ELYCH|nr:hypothetical protein EGW08_023131 [Elysia chlorotica]
MEESNPEISYRDLMRKMKVRFGAEIRSETAYLRLQNAVQERGETLHEWADRLCDLARRAVTSGQGSSHILNVMVVMRFCLGCRDKRTGVKVYEQGPPENLGDAIKKLEWLQHIEEASKLGLAYPRNEEFRRDEEGHERREANLRVYQVAQETFRNNAREAESEKLKSYCGQAAKQVQIQAVGDCVTASQVWEERFGRLEKLVATSVEKLTSKVDQIADEMEGVKRELVEIRTSTEKNRAWLEELRRGRGTSILRSRSVSPRGCYKCGEMGHHIKECPQLDKCVSFKDDNPLN